MQPGRVKGGVFMTLAYRDPFEQLQNELDRMLGAAFGSVGSAGGLYPPVNVFDAADAFVIKAELPGVTPEQVQIEVENDTLTLRGERAFSEPSGEAAYHRRERGAGQFRRVVRMPGRLDSEGAKAEYRDGVLTVRVPKARETRPRRVEIQAS
jgi:HSP20 family protein